MSDTPKTDPFANDFRAGAHDRLIEHALALERQNAKLVAALSALLSICEEELDEHKCPEMTRARAVLKECK